MWCVKIWWYSEGSDYCGIVWTDIDVLTWKLWYDLLLFHCDSIIDQYYWLNDGIALYSIVAIDESDIIDSCSIIVTDTLLTVIGIAAGIDWWLTITDSIHSPSMIIIG